MLGVRKSLKPFFYLFSDSVVTVLLAEWHLTTDYFDGSTVSRPVPRFFAPNPEEVREAMTRDPAKVFKDLQRIYARLFVSEHVPDSEAWAYVGNPR
jgi:hypothetical protein